ncbi:MAG: SRPBCC family protein [Phreatobacter sp.]|uniref:SRPBCC family protein n=1 Tax=Phreatobacter sp. TaxID=1966341 RepID=UPI001A529D31|nr:SRPBCC family protein [Phreatobacter sp.]MBL8567913.1 SRPBCC family protein [Phreatobacter sp.]
MTIPHTVFDPTLDLELKREVDVSPHLVWRAWTEPELLMKWFTPAPWRTTACELDLRPGGKFRTVMEGPAGERHDNTGCVLAVVPQQLLVFTDALGPGYRPTGSAFMTGSVSITPAGKGTLYIARAIHKDVDAKKQHEEMGFHQGWATALDQLVALAKTL